MDTISIDNQLTEAPARSEGLNPFLQGHSHVLLTAVSPNLTGAGAWQLAARPSPRPATVFLTPDGSEGGTPLSGAAVPGMASPGAGRMDGAVTPIVH